MSGIRQQLKVIEVLEFVGFTIRAFNFETMKITLLIYSIDVPFFRVAHQATDDIY